MLTKESKSTMNENDGFPTACFPSEEVKILQKILKDHTCSCYCGSSIKLFKDPEKQDSYVKVTLNQNYRSVKAKKTGTVRGVKDPSFFECFNFRLTPEAADVSSLCFEAFQSVSIYGRDKLIGKFILGSPMFARGKGMAHWTSAFSNPKEAFQQWHTLSG